MRILDVTQFYSPFGGGVKRYLTEKRAFVQAHTCDEHVLVIPGDRDRTVREGRLTLRTIASPPVSFTSRYRVLLRLEALRRIIREERPDIIESGDPYHVAWAAIAEGRRLGVPVVGFYHSHFPEAYLRTASRLGGPGLESAVLSRAIRYVRHLHNNFDSTLVCAEPLRRTLRGWGVDNVEAVRLGADMDAFCPGEVDTTVRPSLGIAPDAFLLTYVGRLVREKNVPVLLDAFRRLVFEHPGTHWHLLMVGQGPLARAVHRLAAETGALTWTTGFGEKRELAKVYRASDIVVHPSVNETFGLVPVEAQACGRLVVGIRGGNLELNIRAGLEYWSSTNDGAGLAASILRLASADRAPLEQVAARAVRAEFAWPVVLGQLWDVYRAVIARHKPRPVADLV
jgi:alpha-1,6-mannosyltransferase